MESQVYYVMADHWRNYSPGQRFGFEAFESYLEAEGIKTALIPLRTPQEEKLLRQKGHYLKKAILLYKWAKRRRSHIEQIPHDAIVMLFRYLYPAFTNRYERLLKKKAGALLLFVDEAYWLLQPSPYNAIFGFLKRAFSKYPQMFRLLDGAVATNPYSAEMLREHCPRVEFIPHVIDTEVYLPAKEKNEREIWVGWSGSFSSYLFVEPMVPFLLSLRERYPHVRLLFLGTDQFRNLRGVISEPWTPENDIPMHQKIDIGLAPYSDNEQTRTKCPVKLLVYMALGIPVIASPVGMVPQMVRHGETGFLAKERSEWEKYIIQLIEDSQMRKEMGKKAREHVEKNFSVKRWAPKYYEFIRSFM